MRLISIKKIDETQDFQNLQKILLNFYIYNDGLYINPQKGGSCSYFCNIISCLYMYLTKEDYNYIDFQNNYLSFYKNIIENYPKIIDEYISIYEGGVFEYFLYNEVYYIPGVKNVKDLLPNLNLNEIIQILLYYKNNIKILYNNDENLIKSYSDILQKVIETQCVFNGVSGEGACHIKHQCENK